jgi:hypothetical protein
MGRKIEARFRGDRGEAGPGDQPVSETFARLGGFGRWMLGSRWYFEGTIGRAPGLARPDGGDAAGVFGSPPQLAVALPARVRCRYLRGGDPGPHGQRRCLQDWLDDGPQDFDSLMGRLEAATQYLVELVLDMDGEGRAVCREVTVRSPTSRPELRWQQYGPGVLLMDDAENVRNPAEAGVVVTIPAIPIREVAFRSVGWWRRVTGTKLPMRRRGFTPEVLRQTAEVCRGNPKRQRRAVADHFGWEDAQGWPNYPRAKRAIAAAREDGHLGPAPGPRRKGEAPLSSTPRAVGKATG